MNTKTYTIIKFRYKNGKKYRKTVGEYVEVLKDDGTITRLIDLNHEEDTFLVEEKN